MDLLQKQQHINNLKTAQNQFSLYASYYSEVADLFNVLVKKLETGLETDYQTLRDKSEVLTNKLRNQDLNQRLNFINLNKFNQFDLELLSGLLSSEIQNSVPVLELFPGSGQFLPYAVAGEPLYIADKFIDVCNEAAKSLNNEFYANRRLRKYEVDVEDFSTLPQQAFGIVYCFNEFFMSNEDYILQVAQQMYKLLYDGGKFIFNFMPDDQVWAQQLSLTGNFTTINYKNLIENLTVMGYTITNYDVRQLKSSYIIASKGTVPTPRLKVGGGYAEIIDN
jgi:SAM-dependent methyltransferase